MLDLQDKFKYEVKAKFDRFNKSLKDDVASQAKTKEQLQHRLTGFANSEFYGGYLAKVPEVLEHLRDLRKKKLAGAKNEL